MQVKSDLLQLESNTQGCDYVITDVHGNVALLQKIIERLEAGDRLFINGDLLDRGKNSLEVMNIILNANKDQVFVTRGNHENLFLKFYESISKSKDSYTPEDDLNILIYLENGGEWVLSDDAKGQWSLCQTYRTRYRLSLWTDFMKSQSSPSKLAFDLEKLRPIAEYFKTLPYCIHIKGDDRKLACDLYHADRAISSEEFKRRITSEEGLLEHEKTHATWSRKGKAEFGRHCHENSDRLYVGHSVLFDPEDAVRGYGRVITLDTSGLEAAEVLLLNHTKSEVELVSFRRSDETTPRKQLECAQKYIQVALKYPLVIEEINKLKQELQDKTAQAIVEAYLGELNQEWAQSTKASDREETYNNGLATLQLIQNFIATKQDKNYEKFFQQTKEYCNKTCNKRSRLQVVCAFLAATLLLLAATALTGGIAFYVGLGLAAAGGIGGGLGVATVLLKISGIPGRLLNWITGKHNYASNLGFFPTNMQKNTAELCNKLDDLARQQCAEASLAVKK